jgi:FixJ family two-component response regulator
MSLQTPARPLLVGVVEDDAAVLSSLEFALQAEGYRVCAFASASEAGASTDVLGCDCVVLDYAMPDLTGTQLLSRLRERGLTCPAIIIASNPHARCRRESQEAGAPVIEKPFTRGDLLGHIRRSLAANEERRLG